MLKNTVISGKIKTAGVKKPLSTPGLGIAMASKDSFLMVAAMDFGTTYSGYAYSFTHEPDRVIVDTKWIAGSRCLMSLKTPTCILLGAQKQFHSFGYEAENKYTSLTESDNHRDWYFFRHFKMVLHNSEGLKRSTIIEDITGKQMPALVIISLSIEYLKNHLMWSLKKKLPDIRETDILFVVTVPAIWDEIAKRFMREAAIEAGIDGKRLRIALEPEAASMWCQAQPLEKIYDSTGSNIPLSKSGTQYMVVDLGGGTADITVHEKKKDGTLRELHCASGGPWGGTAVDINFLNLLGKIVGADVMARFAKELTEDMMDLLREFETKKRTIDSSTDGLVTFKVPASLKEMYEESGKSIQKAISISPYSQSLKWVGDKFRLDVKIVKDLFGRVIRMLVSHIRDLVLKPKLKNVSTILLVGGFAECRLVQDVIEREFHEKRILIPEECGLAVLKGAVLFGHTPSIVALRVSRYTYGIKCNYRFDPSIHREDYKFESVDGPRVSNIFEPYVLIGDDLPIGFAVSKDFKNFKNKDEVILEIYISSSRDPVYVTDKGCHLLGTFTFHIPPAPTYEERGVIASMVFGDTEMKFEVIHEETMEKGSTFFDI